MSHSICGRPGMDDDIQSRRIRKNVLSRELPQATLQSISIDGRSPMLRNDESDSRMRKIRKGSNHPNVEMFGSESLP